MGSYNNSAWRAAIKRADDLLISDKVPPSDVIISLIKKVNPTLLNLNDLDKENGYDAKVSLQNLLLIHYGSAFKLEKLPWDEDIVLIKHKILPLVDACHTNIHRLSAEAFEVLNKGGVSVEKKPKIRKSGSFVAPGALSPEQLVKEARHYIDDEYDYEKAGALLETFFIAQIEDFPILEKAVSILNDELGLWSVSLSVLCSLPMSIIKDRKVRELLAQAYWQVEDFSVARVIFEELSVNDLCKKSLFCFADIKFREEDYIFSYKLIQKAEESPHYVDGLDNLKGLVEAQLTCQAQSIYDIAAAEFENDNLDSAKKFAQDALDVYPNFKVANVLIQVVNELLKEKLQQELWAKLDKESDHATRLRLLKKLLTLDNKNVDRINEMLSVEANAIRALEKQQLVSRAEGFLVAQDYSRFFDVIFPVMRSSSSLDFSSLTGHYPLVDLLLGNDKIIKLKEHEAKECWLQYVNSVKLYQAQDFIGSFELLKSVQKAFSGMPCFTEMLDDLFIKQADLSRTQVKIHLNELSQSCHDWRSFESLKRRIELHLQYLGSSEIKSINATVEACNEKLKKEDPQSWHVESLRRALLKGNTAEADKLSSEIWDEEKIVLVETEVAAKFKIECTEITLCLDGIGMNLNFQQGDLLQYYDSYNGKIVAINDSNEIVIIDTISNLAHCYKFLNLEVSKLRIQDVLEDRNLFLIQISGDCYISALLDCNASKVLYMCDVAECFGVGGDNSTYIADIKYGAQSDNYLVLSIGEDSDEGSDTIVVALGNLYKNSFGRESKVDASSDLKRISSHPYNLLVHGFGLAKTVDSSLKSKHLVAENDIDYLTIDKQNKLLFFQTGAYANENGAALLTLDFDLNVVDKQLGLITAFNHSYCVKGYNSTHRLFYFDFNENIYFYSTRLNKFSKRYTSHNILPTTCESDFFYCIYNKNESTMSISRVTENLHSILEWKEDSSTTAEQ